MPRPVALECFLPPPPPEDPAGAEPPPPAGESAASAPAEPERGIEPESVIDPETARLERLERIGRALGTIAADQSALRARWVREAAAALGSAAATVVPGVARAGFAALVAETAESVLVRGRWPELRLLLALDDADAVAGHLGGPGTERIRLVPDPSLESGEARLEWEEGGAELCADDILRAALDRLRAALDGIGANQGEEA